jgi:hypothetical protein
MVTKPMSSPGEVVFEAAQPKLAPSELVLFHAEDFAQAGSMRLPHTNTRVSAQELGQTILAVAVLANERARTVDLKVDRKEALFGCLVTRLVIEAADTRPDWPVESLEYQVWSAAGSLPREGRHDVFSNVHALLKVDSAAPWKHVVNLVAKGLVERGLLEVDQEAWTPIFSPGRCIPPLGTAFAIGHESAIPIQEMIADCQQTQPELWRQLVEEIRSAVRQRFDDEA